MDKLNAFDVGLGQYCKDGSPCVVAFEAEGNPRVLNEKVYLKSEADNVISELEEKHKKEVDRLLMKIASLEKLVETADKLLKPKGGFAIEDITFKGVKLEGFKKEAE